MNAEPYIHVAVGVVSNRLGQVLISLRHESAHQGGLWEFPGGKVEPGESVEQALRRELKEELDILPEQVQPLIKIIHQYPNVKVLLDVWRVNSYTGQAQGREGQQIQWADIENLPQYDFPEANYPIITAIRLPDEYAILSPNDDADLWPNFNALLASGVKLIQARIKPLSERQVAEFFQRALPLCRKNGMLLMINSAVKNAEQFDVDGIHLSSQDLLLCRQRPAGYQWVAASCHNHQELHQAEQIGVDFVVLAPVLSTPTHPGTEPLGWEKFTQLTASTNIPVYALGGMKRDDIRRVQLAGALGVAGISAFLTEN